MSKIKILNVVTWTFILAIIALVVYYNYGETTTENAEFTIAQTGAPLASLTKSTPLKDSIVAYGMEFLGTPYVTAGCSKDGFDCSGFVYFVFQHFNIETPRSSASFENFGTEIPIASVEKGDVLLFLSPTRNEIGHIGIVSKADGMKSDFIHSTSGREMQVVVTSLTNKGYTKRFVKAIRVLK